ncbi:MAG: DUF2703 domain-containing protein [Candidatus Micrarchaeota archaeon]
MKNSPKKLLKIKWQRLMDEGKTCPRCGSTEKELKKAVSALNKSLSSRGIKVILEKSELSVSEFKKNPLQSNRILVNNVPLEEWVKGKTGESPCCDVCGSSKCRTVEVKGKAYETISAKLVIEAGLAAASYLNNSD